MSDLNRAIEIAASAHKGQTDKGGMPYILHPLRVMLAMDNEVGQIAAVLHDVVEDTGWSLEDIADEGFAPEVITALERLTRRHGEDYFDYVGRAGANPISRAVKLADLSDNLDPKRQASITDAQVRKYVRARAILWEVNGDKSHLFPTRTFQR